MARRSLLLAAAASSLALGAAGASNGTLRGVAAAAARGNTSELAAAHRCSRSWGACLSTRCCGAGYTCYEKDTTYAQCQPTGQCLPGVHENDPVPTYWSCHPLSRGPPDAPPGCSPSWGSCQLTRCCGAGYTCYQKDGTYAQCQPEGQCVPGVHEDDPVKTPWSCRVLSPRGPPAPEPPAPTSPPAAPTSPPAAPTSPPAAPTSPPAAPTSPPAAPTSPPAAPTSPPAAPTSPPAAPTSPPAAPTSPPAPPTTTRAPRVCQDFNESCPGWAAIGQCEKNPLYMLPYCPLSCGVCV